MIRRYFKIILMVWLVAVVIFPQLALAGNAALDKLGVVGSGSAGPYATATETSLSDIIGAVISGALALLGVIFLALIFYAGYDWMTARGEEEKVTKAKDTITRAIIGIIIVVGAYAIYNFIFTNFIAK